MILFPASDFVSFPYLKSFFVVFVVVTLSIIEDWRLISRDAEFGNCVVVQNFDLFSAKLDDALSSLWQWQIDGERAGVVNLWCKRRFSMFSSFLIW